MRNDTMDEEMKIDTETIHDKGREMPNFNDDTLDKEFKEARASRKARRKKEAKKKKSSLVVNIFTTLFILGTLGIITVLTLLYGPYAGFRDWLVTTAMTTMTHQYFATWFFDDDTIGAILSNNKIVETDEMSDENAIVVSDTIVTEFENEFERQILERKPKNNDYKIIQITGKKYDGYLVAVYDPGRVKAACTKKLGKSGQYVTTMAKDNDALIAINGGGFNDPNYNSTGGDPLGITVVGGQFITQAKYTGSGGVIGFTNSNKLVLGKMTVNEAIKRGIRDAVTFGPYLIVNGKASNVVGNGGWGSAPRTVIGQRKDGIVLFLIIDGRTVKKPGADMDDLIDIMQDYGAYNAANLDGGTSSVLVIDGTIVNDPIDSTGAHKTRPIASAFYVTKDDSDDSDHSLVQDRLD